MRQLGPGAAGWHTARSPEIDELIDEIDQRTEQRTNVA
jgi:hypothetical protein